MLNTKLYPSLKQQWNTKTALDKQAWLLIVLGKTEKQEEMKMQNSLTLFSGKGGTIMCG